MECCERSTRELNRIFESISTLDDIETLVNNMQEPMPAYQRLIIEKRFVLQIADVNSNIENLKTMCERLKEELKRMLEENVEKIALLKQKVLSLSKEISDKNIYINSLEEKQNGAKRSCDQAESNLSESKKALSIAENKLDNAKTAQDRVAAGSLGAAPLTFLFPLGGQIFAAILVAILIVMKKDIEDKKEYVLRAETEVSNCKNKLAEINKKHCRLNDELKEHTTKIANINKEEKLLSNFVSTLETAKRNVSNFLSMCNTGFHQLTVASGRSRVFYSQIKYAYNVDHLKPLLTALLNLSACLQILSYLQN